MIWLIGSAYGYTKGIRFAVLMVPAFAITFGIGVGLLYPYLSKWITSGLHINTGIAKLLVGILLCMLLIAPLHSAHTTARNEIILKNDGWYNTLTKIKNESPQNSIITSWWDYGHWFVAIAQRRVTFDGADQGERIHWVGKSLLTDNEETAVGLLRMLNCGHEKAPHILENYTDNDTVKAVDILNKIIVEDKKGAAKILADQGLNKKQIDEVLSATHCDNLLPQYYITSEDMVKKSGVWAHFGSWDFKRAVMYNTIIKKNSVEGVEILKERFNLSSAEADNIYNEIQTTDADQWVSGWPGYVQGKEYCTYENETIEIIKCRNGIEIELSDYNVSIQTQQGGRVNPKSIVYVSGDNIVEKKFNNTNFPYSIILISDEKNYYIVISAPELANSMFTKLFYLKGHGLKHFKLFNYDRSITEGDIYTWTVEWAVDLEGKEKD